MRLLFTLILFFSSYLLPAQQALTFSTPFERDPEASASYPEVVEFFEFLDRQHPQVQLIEAGPTDSGRPLHLAILSADGDFDPVSLREKDKRILFILNAIHPGEPCGVDATMLFFRDLLTEEKYRDLLEKVVVVTVPFYNIGGGLNRGSFSRANQEGPRAYGFRGNAQNLDLNRDFIKCDSRNAQTFSQVFARWQPDFFIDTHTSNGADYTYTMTYVATQKDKLDPGLAAYLTGTFLPDIRSAMTRSGWEMTPYVYSRNTPDEGIYGFLDLPRYSSGYAALHHAIGIMTETHMLKPFRDRVQSTYAFLDLTLHLLARDARQVGLLREAAREATVRQRTFSLDWKLDPARPDSLLFKGYAARYKPSAVSGKERLYYDREQPYEKIIPYYNTFAPALVAEAPFAYILPQAYVEVANRLQWNGVQMKRLTREVTIEVEQYYIRDHKTSREPYEGHFLHSEVQVEPVIRQVEFQAGDWVIHLDQPLNRFMVETLEPQAPDSYFAWNFFDGILMQKEYFSSYVFEDVAARILEEQPALREALEQKKAEDPRFADSPRAQLEFVYQRSPYYEPTYRLYPVGRLLNPQELPVEADGQ